jgi:hypothetical protein
MGIKLVVMGSKKFSDTKLMYRALDAVHRKHFIDTLVTGARPGAEEMAHQWAVAREIRAVVTIPGNTLYGRKNLHDRNCDMLQYFRPEAVVVFSTPRESASQDMIQSARGLGYTVWDVTADWK